MLVLYILVFILLADLIRSAVVMYRLNKQFHEIYAPYQREFSLGQGPALHVALLGDSGIDGHALNKIKFGMGQTLIENLAKHHTVKVHLFAVKGAKSYDVCSTQLPQLKKLKQLDVVVVYMGANNIIKGQSATQVKKDYESIINYAKTKDAVVVSTEIADYYLLTMFSVIHKMIIYFLNKSVNVRLQRLQETHDNFYLVGMKGLTKRFFTKEYQADRLHPNDKALRIWSDVLFDGIKSKKRIKQLL